MEKLFRAKSRVRARYLQRWKTDNRDDKGEAISKGEGL